MGEEGEGDKAGTEDGRRRDDDCNVESLTGDSGVSSDVLEALGAILTLWPAAFRAVRFSKQGERFVPTANNSLPIPARQPRDGSYATIRS